MLAAERAARLLAHEEAARHYERALQLLELREHEDSPHRSELWLALGQAQARSGETTTAQETFERAAEIARQMKSATHLARAALGFAGSVVTPGLVNTHVVALLTEALAELGEADPALRVRLLGRLAMEHLYSPHRDRREGLSHEALDLARRLDDHATLAFALNARHFAILGPDTLEQQLEVSIEIAQLAEATGDRELALQSFPWRMADLLDLGHVRAADGVIETAARFADELRRPLYRWYAAVFRAMRTLMEGRLAESEGLIYAAHNLGQHVQPGAAHVYFASQLFILRWEQGRLLEVDETFRVVLQAFPGMLVFRCLRMLAALQAGHTAEAQAELDSLSAENAAALPHDQLWLGSVALMSEVSAQLRDRAHAAMLYDLLLPYTHRNVMVGVTIGLGAAAAYLGQLAATLGHWDEAAKHFGGALVMNARIGARSWLARAQYHFATMLLQRGQRADRARAAELLAQADATASELGMTYYAERIRPLRAMVPSAERPFPGGLTAREAEVLRLIAAGQSNKEIAAALVVGVPTVEPHITHVYEKIHARSRADATAYALKHGLA